MSERLLAQLIKHEGLKFKPYRDTTGHLTIGIGRNLDSNGISRNEAVALCLNDIDTARLEAKMFTWYQHLDDVRKDVITELVFNMGMPKLLTFKKMLKALENRDFDKAAAELWDSNWRQQVGQDRARTLFEEMKTGAYV